MVTTVLKDVKKIKLEGGNLCCDNPSEKCPRGIILNESTGIKRYKLHYWKRGTFDSNNGVFLIIDEYGTMYISKEGDVSESLLIERGFERKKMFVPFSNGDLPSDPSLRVYLFSVLAA